MTEHHLPGLYADDAQIIADWAAHGIPTNASSQNYAAQLLARLLDKLREAWDIIDRQDTAS